MEKSLRKITEELVTKIYHQYLQQIARVAQLAIEDGEIDDTWSINIEKMQWEKSDEDSVIE